jgi:hypothetical protein
VIGAAWRPCWKPAALPATPQVPAGATVSLDGLRLVLGAGTFFDLESWTVLGDSDRPAVPPRTSPSSKRNVVQQVRALFGKSRIRRHPSHSE